MPSLPEGAWPVESVPTSELAKLDGTPITNGITALGADFEEGIAVSYVNADDDLVAILRLDEDDLFTLAESATAAAWRLRVRREIDDVEDVE